MMDVIYLTDNELDERLAEKCRELLLLSIGDNRLISVSRKPIDFGVNVCVGEQPRSALLLEKQIEAGLKIAASKFVAIAEHDCVYSSEHFAFIPDDDSSFWYNQNVWILNADSKEFSFLHHRRIQSQMICSRELLLKATEDKKGIVGDADWRWPLRPIGEPGVADPDKSLRRLRGRSPGLQAKIMDYATKYRARAFKTPIPNIDIRNGQNLTGGRRGRLRTMNLWPWGTAEMVLGAK